MNLELYSMLLLPSDEVAMEINNKLNQALGKRINLPHITLGKPFHSTKKNIRTEVKSWLEMQRPFRFNLDEIENFDSGIIYLTSSNQDDQDKLRDLFYGIKSVAAGNIEENIGFLPHLTLIYRGTKKSDINQTISILKEHFDEGIPFEINKIKINQSLDNGRWKDLGFFNLGEGIDYSIQEMIAQTV